MTDTAARVRDKVCIANVRRVASRNARRSCTPQPTDTLVRSMAEGEEALIVNAIAASGGNLTLAARRLNIAKSTLYAKMQRYGLTREAARTRSSH